MSESRSSKRGRGQALANVDASNPSNVVTTEKKRIGSVSQSRAPTAAHTQSIALCTTEATAPPSAARTCQREPMLVPNPIFAVAATFFAPADSRSPSLRAKAPQGLRCIR